MNKTGTKSKVIEKIELELLSTLFKYVAPFIDKKIKTDVGKIVQNPNNLENIVNHKPKIILNDIKELECLLLKNISTNVDSNKNFSINNSNLLYSLSFIKPKNNNKRGNYSISIKYEENQTDEKLSITVKKDGKEFYSAEITDKKDAKDRVAPYSVIINYEDKYGEERLTITYRQQLKNYLHKHIEEKEDMANRVPLKWLNILPETSMGGVLGFTYIGDNSMGRREDLTGKTARMVDIHESIHTPDEYETRCITQWIMSKERSRYIK